MQRPPAAISCVNTIAQMPRESRGSPASINYSSTMGECVPKPGRKEAKIIPPQCSADESNE